MNWVLDAILLVFYILIILIYTRRGFVKSIWGFVKAIASVVAACVFGPAVGRWMYDAFVLKATADAVNGALTPMLTQENGAFDVSAIFNKLPASFTELVERYGADVDELSERFGEMTTASDADIEVLASRIAEPVARTVSQIAGYILVFLSALLVLFIIGQIVMLIAELPVAKTVNGALGGLLGALVGLIYVWVVCLCLSIFIENGMANNPVGVLSSIAESSYVFRLFCDISPFDYINITSIIDAFRS